MQGTLEINDIKSFNSQLSFENFQWKIRDGKTALFWEDWWGVQGVLKEKFERLYYLSNLKRYSVFDFISVWQNQSTSVDSL